MAQLIQRVASWLAQEVAVPLIARSKPFQAAARASVEGVEKVRSVSKTAAEAAAEAKAKSKEALAQARAEAAQVAGHPKEEGGSIFKSLTEAVKKVRFFLFFSSFLLVLFCLCSRQPPRYFVLHLLLVFFLLVKDLSRHGKTEEQLLQEAIEENQRKSMEMYLKEQQRMNSQP